LADDFYDVRRFTLKSPFHDLVRPLIWRHARSLA
jgi:hypothetical protein